MGLAEEFHTYTDSKTRYSVFKVWRLLGAITGAYYKLYDGGGKYVRRYETKAEAIQAAKDGD